MPDIVEMLRVDRAQAEAKAQRNRDQFPGVTAIVDELRSAFGADQVKVRWACEDGREVGKPISFEGTDVDKIIRLDDMRKRRVESDCSQ